jgi:hypothetical protein
MRKRETNPATPLSLEWSALIAVMALVQLNVLPQARDLERQPLLQNYLDFYQSNSGEAKVFFEIP